VVRDVNRCSLSCSCSKVDYLAALSSSSEGQSSSSATKVKTNNITMSGTKGLPAVIQKETISVLDPTRTRLWQGSVVWPPPDSTLPRVASACTQDRETAAAAETMWGAVKSTIYDDPDSATSANALATPVNQLYGDEIQITAVDRYAALISLEVVF